MNKAVAILRQERKVLREKIRIALATRARNDPVFATLYGEIRGASDFRTPCLIHKVGVLKMVHDARTHPFQDKGPAVPLYLNLVTSAAQAVVFIATGSVALLADLIHNFGDALTAVPLGIAFLLRSFVAEKRAGYFVVATIT